MSIRIMSLVWETGPAAQGDTLVLLALADFANDDGQCWPALKSIAQKARMTERGAQKIIRRLEVEGWLEIDTGNGRHGCNKYTIKTPNEVHPERGSPRTSMQKTPNVDAETPNVSARNPEPRSPEPLEPSRTVREPSPTAREIRDLLGQIVRLETAEDFIAHRKQMKKPLTALAAKRMVAALADHPDPDAVFDLSIQNQWQGIFPENVTCPNGGRHDRPNQHSQATERPDPALEQIARLAGVSQTSGNGRF